MPHSFFYKIFAAIYSCYRFIFGTECTCDTWCSRNSIVVLFKLNTHSNLVVEFENNVFSVDFFSSKSQNDIHYYCCFVQLIRIILRNYYCTIPVQELVECYHCKLESFALEDLFNVLIAGYLIFVLFSN
jgi:hypothetical protein